MHNNLKMGGHKIINLNAVPTNSNDATSKHYVDTNVYRRDGKTTLTGDLNIAGHRILNLRTPRDNSEVATKKYVDDNKVDTTVFMKKDGTSSMTGNLNVGNNKIKI